jgi:hypothetical protein
MRNNNEFGFDKGGFENQDFGLGMNSEGMNNNFEINTCTDYQFSERVDSDSDENNDCLKRQLDSQKLEITNNLPGNGIIITEDSPESKPTLAEQVHEDMSPDQVYMLIKEKKYIMAQTGIRAIPLPKSKAQCPYNCGSKKQYIKC